MALEMRSVCEKCNAVLPQEGEAYICSYECSCGKPCAEAMQGACPNCGGERRRRPRRKAT